VVAATASDPDGSISRVRFFAGTQLIGTTVSPPYFLIWTNVSAGNYLLTAQATDNAGMTAVSPAVNFTVAGVAIVSPTNNLVAKSPANISLSSVAVDNAAISQVQYFSGTTNVGAKTLAPYSVAWTNISAGIYRL